MEEIYWIQRIGALNVCCIVFAVISLGALLFVAAINSIELDEDDDEETISRAWGRARKLLYSAIFFTLLAVFVPSEKDMYAIYGIGGTIDYIKSNDNAKQLPDKVVNALDKWIDEKTKEDKE